MSKQQAKKQAKKAHKQARRAARWMMTETQTQHQQSGGGCYTPTRTTTTEPIVSTPVDALLFNQMAQVYVGGTIPPEQELAMRPLTIILTPQGICEVRTYRHMHLVRFPGSAETKLTLHSQLPAALYFAIVGLFKAINAKYSAEALVYIWRHDNGEFALTVPEQTVHGASANPTNAADAYTPPAAIEGAEGSWHLWGHIHSHNTMSAFFSGTDDASEQEDGLIYGVVGHITRPVPEVKFRARTQGIWLPLDPAVVIARGEGTIRVKPTGLDYFITVPYSLANAAVEYPEPPAEWVERIKGHSYTSGSNSAYRDWRGHHGSTPYVPGEFSTRGRRVDLGSTGSFFRKVIRLNGNVDTVWANGESTFSGKTVADYPARDRREFLMEGVDWNPPVGAAKSLPAASTAASTVNTHPLVDDTDDGLLLN